jgi:hypothetical protein
VHVKIRKIPKTTIPFPVLGAIAATRALLGVGIGLLLSPRIARPRRRALGWALLGIGLISTIPLGTLVLRNRERPELAADSSVSI